VPLYIALCESACALEEKQFELKTVSCVNSNTDTLGLSDQTSVRQSDNRGPSQMLFETR